MVPKRLLDEKRKITIAGTVGVGKSTLARGLADALGYKNSFEDVEGNAYLKDFYDDFKEWSFRLQVSLIPQRFKEQMKMENSKDSYVEDRSIYEDAAIFAKMLYEQGNMTERDYETYKELFNVIKPFVPKPDVLIYITGDFEKIMDRIKIRGRKMEQDTPESYWEDLYYRYENWIKEFDICPVVTIDIEEYDLIKDPKSIHKIIDKINEKIN